MVSRFFARTQRVGLASVAAALIAFSLGVLDREQPASAAKPGGGGAAHTSRIYYTQSALAIHYQMFEDGANKTALALPAGLAASPSSLVYGGARWWLTVEIDVDTGYPELFAYREGGAPPVQLTLAGPDVLIGLGAPRWSNDGQDRFVTFDADTVAGGSLCRLWIAGDDIAAIQSGAPPFIADDIEFVLPHMQGYADYFWSHQDGMLAYLKHNYDGAGNNVGRTIWVRGLTDPPTDVPIHTPANGEGAIKVTGGGNHIQWSPDGSRISFSTYNSSSRYGGVWTVAPDGTQAVKVRTNSGTLSYTSRGWSPTGQELLLHTIKDRGFGTWYYNLARMPAAGGTLTTLTGDLVQTRDKTAVRWVPLGP